MTYGEIEEKAVKVIMLCIAIGLPCGVIGIMYDCSFIITIAGVCGVVLGFTAWVMVVIGIFKD